MRRRPIMAGNWKMHMLVAEAEALVRGLISGLDGTEEVDVVVAPPFPSLYPVGKLLSGSPIALAAQNLHWEASGAYTGEVSAAMLLDVGCRHVIIGHSERRAYFGETDETVNKKIKTAFAHGLLPIMCVGETLIENESGITAEVVSRQVHDGLLGVEAKSVSSLVIAYEPVWAIGTGRAATAEGANAVIADIIRGELNRLYGNELAQQVRVLYGGSVKSSNAQEFFQQTDIDGALVGGASLKTTEFISIVRAAAH